MEKIAKQIIAYRAKKSLSQEEFAKRCNLSLKTISRAEQGEKLSKITVEKIRQTIMEV